DTERLSFGRLHGSLVLGVGGSVYRSVDGPILPRRDRTRKGMSSADALNDGIPRCDQHSEVELGRQALTRCDTLRDVLERRPTHSADSVAAPWNTPLPAGRGVTACALVRLRSCRHAGPCYNRSSAVPTSASPGGCPS